MENIKMIIEKIYRDHNPDKISNVPGILEKYKDNDGELLAKISQKYNIHLDDYISVDYLRLIKKILTKYDPVNVSSASTLLASYVGREKKLLTTLGLKFNTGFNDIIVSIYLTPSSDQGPAAESEKPSAVTEKIESQKREIPDKRNPKKLRIGIIACSVVIVVLAIFYFSGSFRPGMTGPVKNNNSSPAVTSVNSPTTNNPQNPPPSPESMNTETREVSTTQQTNAPQNPPPTLDQVKNGTQDELATQQTIGANPYGNGNGKITIFKTCNDCQDVKISIDGNYIGVLSQTFNSTSVPSCDADGTISKVLSSGRHHLSGQDSNRTSWDILISVPEGKCLLQEIKKGNDVNPNL